MCMEDIKIERATKTRVILLASTDPIPANPRRLGLRLVLDIGDRTTAGNNFVTVRLQTPLMVAGAPVGPLLMETHYNIYSDGVIPQTAVASRMSDEVTLETVGTDLMGTLVPNVNGACIGWLYETYLDTDQVPPIDAGHR